MNEESISKTKRDVVMEKSEKETENSGKAKVSDGTNEKIQKEDDMENSDETWKWKRMMKKMIILTGRIWNRKVTKIRNVSFVE